MANYIMSDIHGDNLSFTKMLKKIEFKEDSDFLIVNGDVLDRGEHGIEILLKVKKLVESGCALMLKGNHELFAQMYLEGTLSEKDWILFSGEGTLKTLKNLDENKKNEILEFIKSLPMYIVYDIPNHGKTVITHTGLMESQLIIKDSGIIDVEESVKKAAETDEYNFLISADIHYWSRDRLNKLDKYIICGHIPTYQLGPEYVGKIFETRAYMDIDAGAGYKDHNGRLACYCIESCEKIYI